MESAKDLVGQYDNALTRLDFSRLTMGCKNKKILVRLHEYALNRIDSSGLAMVCANSEKWAKTARLDSNSDRHLKAHHGVC